MFTVSGAWVAVGAGWLRKSKSSIVPRGDLYSSKRCVVVFGGLTVSLSLYLFSLSQHVTYLVCFTLG